VCTPGAGTPRARLRPGAGRGDTASESPAGTAPPVGERRSRPGSTPSTRNAAESRRMRLVGADLRRPLEPEHRDPVPLSGDQPTGRGPHRGRRARQLERRSGGGRGTRAAPVSRQPAVAESPATRTTAVPPHRPLRPRQPFSAVPTVGLGRETTPRTRPSTAGSDADERSRVHQAPLLRLDGYPEPTYRAFSPRRVMPLATAAAIARPCSADLTCRSRPVDRTGRRRVLGERASVRLAAVCHWWT
jgi:hypothetical protein